MSEESLDTIRSVYDSINRGDWDRAFRDVHPSSVVTFQRGPNAGTHRGRDAVRAIIEDQLAPFDHWNVEPEEFVEKGDQTVVIVKTRARPKGTSGEIENRNGHLWTIRDGKIVSLETFPDPERALEAAGLGE